MKPALTNFKPALTMRTIILLLPVAAITAAAAPIEIGPRVPPPSSMGYTVESILASGERGGMLLAVGTNFTPECNREMGDAMELWNAHKWDEAREAFHAIWSRHPESPWAAEAELHEACYCKFSGLYDEAEDRFVSLLSKHKDTSEMRRKVLRYLPDLYAKTGRLEDGMAALQCLRDESLNWQETAFLEDYSRVYSRALARDLQERSCGTKALALALAAWESGSSLRNMSLESILSKQSWATEPSKHEAGYSLQELADLGRSVPVQLSLEDLRMAVSAGSAPIVHLKAPSDAKCWSVLPWKRGDKRASTGHFALVERVGGAFVDLIDSEAGVFRLPLRLFVYRWSGTALLPEKHLKPGMNKIPRSAANALRGGCCGSPPPDVGTGTGCGGEGGSEEGPEFPPPFDRGGGGRDGILASPSGGVSPTSPCLGNGCSRGGGGGNHTGPGGTPCCPLGAPQYSFGLISANLALDDIPMWYPAGKGPTPYIQLSFSRLASQRLAQFTNVSFFPFGNKWHMNFSSYLTETPVQGGGSGDVQIMLPHARTVVFGKDNEGGEYMAADTWNMDTLFRTNEYFVLEFQSTGDRWFFNTNTSLSQRLEKIEDKYGNALVLQYSGSSRLSSITDALNRQYTFGYDHRGLVTNILDSLGRSAKFAYSTNLDLVSMTDMGGLTTTIHYDTNHWPTNIVYPSTASWRMEYANGTQLGGIYADYADQGNPAFRIRAIDPAGQTNEYFYHAFSANGGITQRDPAGNTWMLAHKFVDGSGGSERQRIYYTGVNAYDYPYRVAGDQWQRFSYDVNLNPITVARTNGPFATSIGHENDQGNYTAGVLLTNIFNSRNKLVSSTVLTNVVLSIWDPEHPERDIVSADVLGVWTNRYDLRDNLIWNRNPLNQVTRYTYSAKDELLGITNALSQVTSMAYDHNGNLTNLVDALLRTNKWFFNSEGREYEALHPDGQRTTKGYDSIGRLAAVTNHGSGLYLQYHYDDLDRLRDVVFPDGTTNHSEYSCCGLDWTRDRLNRVTSFGRDALGRTTSVTDPENRLTEFRYNGADQITNLITWVNNQQRVKRFDYTSTNGFSRLTEVATPGGKLTRYDYTFRGGLAWRKDGNGNVTKYQYDLLERLVSVTDSNDVELVKMDYDVLGNVTYVSNVHSVFQYSYDGLNRATQAVCLLTNIPSCSTVKYTIDYTFDPVGNVTNRLITGLQGFTDTIRTAYGYDVMNQLTNVVQLTNGVATANAWYAYDTAGRLWKKGYGNGDVVTQTYDSESRLLSMGITNGATMITRYNYLWDVGGNILAITNNGTNIVLYGYDRAGQLTNEISFTNGIAGFATNSWVYDEAGNWLNPVGAGTKWVYNVDNELIARSTTNESAWSATVTGTVEAGSGSNKWYNTWADCRGVWGRVGTNTGAFTLPGIPLYAGTNELLVTVTDVTGNTSQQTRKVFKTVTNCQEYFFYDGNGNLTNWVNGSINWVYQWDWADRLTKVTSNGVVVLENWYDANSHRIGKAELIGSATVSYVYLFDRWDIVGISSAGSGLYETYTRGVALAGDIGGLVGIARHPFNTKYYVHNNHRGDIIHVRANALTLSTHRYTAFGEIIGTTSSVSRFRFSSKEYERSCGLSYYGYRFYAPQWQRWVSSDPVGEKGGINLYAGMENSPISFIDVHGGNAISILVILGLTKEAACFTTAALAAMGTTFPNDSHEYKKHCLVGCLMTRMCGGGSTLDIAGQLGKEVIWGIKDHGWPWNWDWKESWHDTMAEFYGHLRGMVPGPGCGCAQICNTSGLES